MNNKKNTQSEIARTMLMPNSNGQITNRNNDDTNTLAQSIDANQLAVGERVAQLEQKERGIISRLFTDRALSHAISNNKVAEVEDWNKYRSKAFRLATDAKLEACHETCLKMVREIKVDYREQFASFVSNKHADLARTINHHTEHFIEETEKQYLLIEQFKHREFLCNRYIVCLESEIESYFDFMYGLLDNFKAIAKERVDEYSSS